MGFTLIEKILSNHSDEVARPGEIIDVSIDARIARDFGGANVVKNIRENGLSIHDPEKTFFTFDCNPTGSDQKYATNQQVCRMFAREQGIKIYDINSGIGTHIAIDEGLVQPGGTLVSTDSHANILGAVGVFGQGMGDQDIAAAWASGKVWFKVPKSMKIVLNGGLSENVLSKDVALFILQNVGASGLLGYAAEFKGEWIDQLSISDRITIASMATEMGGITTLFPPTPDVISHFQRICDSDVVPVYADTDAHYDKIVEMAIHDLEPLISRPGHPEDVVPVRECKGRKIDSVFIGSCTNGRFEDMRVAADILKDRLVAPGVVLKIVPSTRNIWERCLNEGLIELFIKAGALIGNAGCAGCAAGQIGQNGPGEVTVSTGNRNYAGKQGKGEVYLASPATAAASAVAGMITTVDSIPGTPVLFPVSKTAVQSHVSAIKTLDADHERPTALKGRVWIIRIDNIDTDMIFHNQYLTITDISKMGQYTFDNLEGWNDFAQKAKSGDILVTGSNFGAGSSRQQAVDCFKSLGVQVIVAKSFGAIYERNAINAGLPIVTCDLVDTDIQDGEEITVDMKKNVILRHKTTQIIETTPFADVQMEIYQKGGLFLVSGS